MRYFVGMYFVFCAALLVFGIYFMDLDPKSVGGYLAAVIALALVAAGMWAARDFSWEIKKAKQENTNLSTENN